MPAISEQWPYLLLPGLRGIFMDQASALAAEAKTPMLFRQLSSQKSIEEFLGVGGMGDWDEYKGAIDYDTFDQLYKTTFTHKEFDKGFTVERKLVDDDLYNVINARPAALALSAFRTREKHAASVFNNAFTSGYVGGDGQVLCADAHPLAPTHAGDTQDNAGSSALSYDAVIATRRIMREYTDDRGELLSVMPDTLIVPAELEQTAFEIWRTMNKPNTADYAANFVQGFLKNVIVWDYLTDANNWFLVDSRMAKQHLLWIDRVPLEFALDPSSDFNLVARYRGYMRYSYGWSDWKWVYGHSVS